MRDNLKIADWELLFLDEMNVEVVDNELQTDYDGRILAYKGCSKYKPKYVYNPNNNYFCASVEYKYENANREVIFTRFGDKPGPLTVNVHGDRYTFWEREMGNGLKSIIVSRTSGPNEGTIQIIPNINMEYGITGEEFLTTGFSSIYPRDKQFEMNTFITCSLSSIQVIDPRRGVRGFETVELTGKNYQEKLYKVIVNKFGNDNQISGFYKAIIPLLYRSFESVVKKPQFLKDYYSKLYQKRRKEIEDKYDESIKEIKMERESGMSKIDEQVDKIDTRISDYLKSENEKII